MGGLESSDRECAQVLGFLGCPLDPSALYLNSEMQWLRRYFGDAVRGESGQEICLVSRGSQAWSRRRGTPPLVSLSVSETCPDEVDDACTLLRPTRIPSQVQKFGRFVSSIPRFSVLSFLHPPPACASPEPAVDFLSTTILPEENASKLVATRSSADSDYPSNDGVSHGTGWISEIAQARLFMKKVSVWERAKIGAIAGGLAGAFTYACLHPLDTVKTKLQTRGSASLYSGPTDVILSILNTKGIPGFYSGISAVLVGSMFSSAIYFGTCELGKSVLSQQEICPPLLIPPVAGAIGNIVSSTILVPKEVITQRMQAGAAGRSWDVLVRTLNQEGVAGLYAGYSAAIFRNLPSSVLSFTTFEYLKAVWLSRERSKTLKPWQSISSGAIAGAISATLTTPLDVVKTRLMTQTRVPIAVAAGTVVEAEATAKIAAFTYQGIISTLKQIWVEESWIGLTRGVGPRLLHSACFSALGYFAFETAKLALVKQHLARNKSLEGKSELSPVPIRLGDATGSDC